MQKLLLLFVLLATAAYAQTSTTTVSGTVQDSSNAVVLEAAVTAYQHRAPMWIAPPKRTVRGLYAISGVTPGMYTLKVESPGMKTF